MSQSWRKEGFEKSANTATKENANYHGNKVQHLGPVPTYPDIFESAAFSFRIRLASTHIRRNRQRIRIFVNPLSRVEKNKSATNPITCGQRCVLSNHFGPPIASFHSYVSVLLKTQPNDIFHIKTNESKSNYSYFIWTKCSTLRVSVRCFIISKFIGLNFSSSSITKKSRGVCLKHEMAKWWNGTAVRLNSA